LEAVREQFCWLTDVGTFHPRTSAARPRVPRFVTLHARSARNRIDPSAWHPRSSSAVPRIAPAAFAPPESGDTAVRRAPKPQAKPATTLFRINRQIRAREVRLIDAAGEQVGVMNVDDARRMAEEAGLDLVEVSPQARPPVCRVMDYGKFKYQQRKKERSGGKKSASGGLKELRVRPAIDDHDLEYRLTNGRRFLEEGNKVQVVCIFRGRQMAHPEHGYIVMKKVAEVLGDISKVESPARLAGNRMTMMLSKK
jgi:translation initiation factor IF-3